MIETPGSRVTQREQGESGLFGRLSSILGDNMTIVRQFCRAVKKCAHLESRKWFLLQCRRQGIFPRHITENVECVVNLITLDSPFNGKAKRLMDDFKARILKLEIGITHWRLKKMEREINSKKRGIQECLHYSNDCRLFFMDQEHAYERILAEKLAVVGRKLVACRQRGDGAVDFAEHQEFLVNVSDVEIPAGVTKLLSLGPKFALPTGRLPIFHMLAETEVVVRNVEDQTEKDRLRSRLVNTLQNCSRGSRSLLPQERLIQTLERETSEFLKEKGQEIVIINSDKGNKTTILNRRDYDSKMEELVNDETTYKLITKDPTHKFQTKNNELARGLYEKGRIDMLQKYKLTTYNAVAPRIYGLPKIHKPGVPLRPVVSFVASPTYNMAKFVAYQLSPLANNPINVRNSEELARFVTEQRLPENHILISLDVVALFTNVPIDLVLQEIRRRYSGGVQLFSPKNSFYTRV
ncbi:uncharacterized protein LOC129809259 [Phlebotomus papatasi]|uniref:uncharacterized protein LOC129809259 n=1 Tax=Phlebotomus papatasi TaxID=29031 RepID=UPI002483A25C|nr:uncharacterized protein LOC129809259 [Phlebotomus papatasi]